MWENSDFTILCYRKKSLSDLFFNASPSNLHVLHHSTYLLTLVVWFASDLFHDVTVASSISFLCVISLLSLTNSLWADRNFKFTFAVSNLEKKKNNVKTCEYLLQGFSYIYVISIKTIVSDVSVIWTVMALFFLPRYMVASTLKVRSEYELSSRWQ